MRAALFVFLILAAGCKDGPGGASGSEGTKGDQGPQGPIGEQGPIGPIGPQGPIGGGIYTSRDNVYCKRVVATVGATALIADARCDSADELPLQGYCDFKYDTEKYLESEGDLNWQGNNTLAAGWSCLWRFHTISPVARNIGANICCIKK